MEYGARKHGMLVSTTSLTIELLSLAPETMNWEVYDPYIRQEVYR